MAGPEALVQAVPLGGPTLNLGEARKASSSPTSPSCACFEMGDENRTPEQIEREAQLLDRRIAESGLSLAAFAEAVLRRESRTVRRWIARENPIPQVVVDFLTHPSPAPWPRTLAGDRPDPVAVKVMLSFVQDCLRKLNEGRVGELAHTLTPGLIRRELGGVVPESLMSETEELVEQVRLNALRRPADAALAISELQNLWLRHER